MRQIEPIQVVLIIAARMVPSAGCNCMYAPELRLVPSSADHYGLDTSVKVHFSSAVHNTTMAVNAIRAVAKK